MLLVLRIITIIVLTAWLCLGGYLVIAGALDTPEADLEAVGLGAIVWACIAGISYLLYRGYKKKHTAIHWVAFFLSVLPVLALAILVIILDNFF